MLGEGVGGGGIVNKAHYGLFENGEEIKKKCKVTPVVE